MDCVSLFHVAPDIEEEQDKIKISFLTMASPEVNATFILCLASIQRCICAPQPTPQPQGTTTKTSLKGQQKMTNALRELRRWMITMCGVYEAMTPIEILETFSQMLQRVFGTPKSVGDDPDEDDVHVEKNAEARPHDEGDDALPSLHQQILTVFHLFTQYAPKSLADFTPFASGEALPLNTVVDWLTANTPSLQQVNAPNNTASRLGPQQYRQATFAVMSALPLSRVLSSAQVAWNRLPMEHQLKCLQQIQPVWAQYDPNTVKWSQEQKEEVRRNAIPSESNRQPSALWGMETCNVTEATKDIHTPPPSLPSHLRVTPLTVTLPNPGTGGSAMASAGGGLTAAGPGGGPLMGSAAGKALRHYECCLSQLKTIEFYLRQGSCEAALQAAECALEHSQHCVASLHIALLANQNSASNGGVAGGAGGGAIGTNQLPAPLNCIGAECTVMSQLARATARLYAKCPSGAAEDLTIALQQCRLHLSSSNSYQGICSATLTTLRQQEALALLQAAELLLCYPGCVDASLSLRIVVASQPPTPVATTGSTQESEAVGSGPSSTGFKSGTSARPLYHEVFFAALRAADNIAVESSAAMGTGNVQQQPMNYRTVVGLATAALRTAAAIVGMGPIGVSYLPSTLSLASCRAVLHALGTEGSAAAAQQRDLQGSMATLLCLESLRTCVHDADGANRSFKLLAEAGLIERTRMNSPSSNEQFSYVVSSVLRTEARRRTELTLLILMAVDSFNIGKATLAVHHAMKVLQEVPTAGSEPLTHDGPFTSITLSIAATVATDALVSLGEWQNALQNCVGRLEQRLTLGPTENNDQVSAASIVEDEESLLSSSSAHHNRADVLLAYTARVLRAKILARGCLRWFDAENIVKSLQRLCHPFGHTAVVGRAKLVETECAVARALGAIIELRNKAGRLSASVLTPKDQNTLSTRQGVVDGKNSPLCPSPTLSQLSQYPSSLQELVQSFLDMNSVLPVLSFKDTVDFFLLILALPARGLFHLSAAVSKPPTTTATLSSPPVPLANAWLPSTWFPVPVGSVGGTCKKAIQALRIPIRFLDSASSSHTDKVEELIVNATLQQWPLTISQRLVWWSIARFWNGQTTPPPLVAPTAAPSSSSAFGNDNSQITPFLSLGVCLEGIAQSFSKKGIDAAVLEKGFELEKNAAKQVRSALQ